LEAVFILLAIFAPWLYWLKRRFDLRELEAGKHLEAKKQLAAATEENQLLAERVANLETIVTSVDYELNLRLARLTAEQSRLALAVPESAPAARLQVVPNAGDSSDVPREGAATAPTAANGPVATAKTSPALGGAGDGLGELGIGQLLAGRYKVERPLGRGGMGAVYLAHDSVLGELIALKVISSAWGADPGQISDRFRREASAARKVSHRNVIRIHDLGETEGLLFMSMEYFPGKTLAELVARRGPLSGGDLRDILGQVCDGLEAAHTAGVIHRDLKPGNVLVGERHSVKLIDFGLATATFFQGMTATGLSLGTPEYMSPEQVRGRPTDSRSDIYSLGALLYHVTTGRPPFSGDSPIAVGFAHCSQEPTPPRAIRSDLSEALDAAIVGALAKEPNARPTLAELRAAL